MNRHARCAGPGLRLHDCPSPVRVRDGDMLSRKTFETNQRLGRPGAWTLHSPRWTSGRTRHLNLEEVLPAQSERVRISGINGSEFPEPTTLRTLRLEC